MAEKGKGKKTAAKQQAGVMSELSATRPPRIGGRRRVSAPAAEAPAASATKAAAKPPAKAAAAKPPAKAAAAKSTRKPAAAKAAAAKPAAGKPAAAKPTAKPAGAKPAAAKRAAAKPAAAKASQPAGMPSRGGVVRETPTRKPRPVRAGSPGLKRDAAKAERPPARTAPPPPPAGAANAPSGTELVTTALQAAGELAQIGVTVGGQILKRAFDRLPKP
jgi:hypothetical protein